MRTYLYNMWLNYKTSILKKKIGSCGCNVDLGSSIIVSKPENLSIGNNVYIGPNAWISSYGAVLINNGVIIGPRLKIYTGNHNYESTKAIPYDDLTIVKKVTIEENVWIGGDVVILPGITIGEGAVIAAASVITKDVPSCSVVGGNPAKVLKERNKELYYKLKTEDKIYLKLKAEGILIPYSKEI